MKQYVTSLAKIFQGFRLDNCHSTPLHVGEYFIRKARKQNPNLIVFSELFTGNKEKDATFMKIIGINALVRETIHSYNSRDIYVKLR